MFHAIWEFAQTEDPQNACQSADCAILIAQTVEPQMLKNHKSLPCLYFFLIIKDIWN